MSTHRLALASLILAGGVLGAIAVFAKERTYVVPEAAAPASIPLTLEGEVPAGFTLRTFDVEGICCQGCSSKLHGALMALEGLDAAAVDPYRKTVTALARADISNERLEAALTFDKYRAHAR